MNTAGGDPGTNKTFGNHEEIICWNPPSKDTSDLISGLSLGNGNHFGC